MSEIVAVEVALSARDRRLDLRYVGPVEGVCVLSDRPDMNDASGVSACRTLSISADRVTIAARIDGAIGDRLTTRLDGFGIVRGTIERIAADGCVFKVDATEQQRMRIAARIDFLKKKAARKQSERRVYKRHQPRDARSTLRFPDGRVLNCLIVDFSRGGVAVATTLRPEIGEPVLIGRLTGRVARHLGSGLGIQFDKVQPIEGLEPLISGYEVEAEQTTPTA
jgi:hypothetical protein